MNAITTTTSHSLVPQTMDQAVRLAEMMSKGRLLPAHLQDKPGDCLMVVEMAMRFGMSPFAVAQCTSVIQGKMMLEGKLVAAALHASGALKTRLDYVYAGEGDARAVTVSATLTGETTPRSMTIRAKDVKTSNALWTKQLDQQLAYSAARNWARRHAPEVMLGVYSPEEFDEPQKAPDTFTGQTIDAHAEPAGTREAINAAVPLAEPPRKATWADWLDARAADFGGAHTRDAVDAILARDDVHKAMDGALKNGGLARLKAMIAEAIQRTSGMDEDGPDGDLGHAEASAEQPA
jgi:RecT family protein